MLFPADSLTWQRCRKFYSTSQGSHFQKMQAITFESVLVKLFLLWKLWFSAYTCTCMYVCMHVWMYVCMYVCISLTLSFSTLSISWLCTYTHTHTNTFSHTLTQFRKHTNIHTHTHTHKHKRNCTLADTPTHTHTPHPYTPIHVFSRTYTHMYVILMG